MAPPDAARVRDGPIAAERGPPTAVPSGVASIMIALRAARTTDICAGGVFAWNSAYVSGVKGP